LVVVIGFHIVIIVGQNVSQTGLHSKLSQKA